MNAHKLDLNKREFGSWFAPFERDLMFVRKQDHIGWVVHISDKTFKLQLTPFFKQFKDYLYVTPDSKLMPPEKMCVEVKPFKIIREPVFNDKSLYGKYNNFCIVDGFKEFKINTQKPDIDHKDFLHHCSVNWNNAEEDGLDMMLALQLVSCPNSFYGKGGLGSLASKLSKEGKLSKTIVPQLSSTFNRIVPSDFQKENDLYFFNMVTTPPELNSIHQIRQHSPCEVNYCRPCLSIDDAQLTSKAIPVQIPLLAKYAKYVKSDELIEHYLLLQYQLTALMHNPTFEENNMAFKKIETNILKIIEARNLDNIFEADANSINKLALAFSRLYLTSDVDNREIDDATDMFFAHWTDWRLYINLSDEFDNFRSTARPSDIQYNLSHDHQRFLIELQKLQDEIKERWVDMKTLEERLDKKIRNIAYEIAMDLNNIGLIIQKDNFSKIRKVMDV